MKSEDRIRLLHMRDATAEAMRWRAVGRAEPFARSGRRGGTTSRPAITSRRRFSLPSPQYAEISIVEPLPANWKLVSA
jgi:hypothetical protein